MKCSFSFNRPLPNVTPLFIILSLLLFVSCSVQTNPPESPRERINIDDGWRFMRYETQPDTLIYDIRPAVDTHHDNVVADTKPTEAISLEVSERALKKWILPTANEFINNPANHHRCPEGSPGSDFPFVQHDFDDTAWEPVNLPHDWAIAGPFYTEANPIIGGGMGRLPVHGVAWYRRKLDVPVDDQGKSIYLDIDGAMSYAMVWLNGHLVGGWPYGYNSFRLDLTPYINLGGDNQLAIRLDNPPHSSRWYPGGGIYRHVWLTKVDPVHIGNWGTFITSKDISSQSATLDLALQLENKSSVDQRVEATTDVYMLSDQFERSSSKTVAFPRAEATVHAGQKLTIQQSTIMKNPALWGPPPTQQPNLYVAVTRLYIDGKPVDEYETRFGIRSLEFHPTKGLSINGEPIRIQGVNQHHDLGALGAAFNTRAAERQLEILQEMGCNAIRMAHNPPAPELLDLTDRMGLLVINEIFDNWERKKTPLDFHLIFPEWHEPDTRAFIRRDRNHPSVIAWSFGNEVGEQYTAEEGASIATKLHQIVKEEDPSRPTTASMNFAKPDMPFAGTMDVISLNYQGEGIRDAPAYAHLTGIRTTPLYPAFRQKFPDKLIISSETASTLSTRGTYVFPVFEGFSAPVSDGIGGDPISRHVSAYELYTAAFGASPDKVFASQDQHPFVAGEFVWTGWDYLGEPTPYYSARSSYSGIVDLAGFKKDRFYLYQARWRPDHKMAHILPHWTWPEREGQITPVHVFSAADEAELFLNDKSLSRKRKGRYEYRFRWDSVAYTPGELRVVTYKDGQPWATDTVRTASEATQLQLTADRNTIKADGKDLAFITLQVLDQDGHLVPRADNTIQFELSGPGEIVATDNGNPADMVTFHATERKAFNGLALVVVRAKPNITGQIRITAKSATLTTAETTVGTTTRSTNN